MQTKSTTIRLNGTTKTRLENIGQKGDSFDDIINLVIHQRNILMIHELCRGESWGEETNLTEKCKEIFIKIGFIVAPPFWACGLNDDTPHWEEWESFDEALEWAIEMATDEDFVGSAVAFGDRELPLGEAVTNTYCLINQIDAPTWSLSRGRRNPFAP